MFQSFDRLFTAASFGATRHRLSVFLDLVEVRDDLLDICFPIPGTIDKAQTVCIPGLGGSERRPSCYLLPNTWCEKARADILYSWAWWKSETTLIK